MPLPTNYTNDTPSQDQHPAAHNQTNAAVNANETAIGRLPKGELSTLNATPGTGTLPQTLTTPSLTLAGRRIRCTVAFTGRSGTTWSVNSTITLPGGTNEMLPVHVISGAADRAWTATAVFAPTTNGTITCSLSATTQNANVVITKLTFIVDDMGAV